MVGGYETDEAYYIPGEEKFGSPNIIKDSINREENFYTEPQKHPPLNIRTFFQNHYQSPYWYHYPNQNQTYTSGPILLNNQDQQKPPVTNYHRPSIGSSPSRANNPRNQSVPLREGRNPRK
jgi:hypothetical protein